MPGSIQVYNISASWAETRGPPAPVPSSSTSPPSSPEVATVLGTFDFDFDLQQHLRQVKHVNHATTIKAKHAPMVIPTIWPVENCLEPPLEALRPATVPPEHKRQSTSPTSANAAAVTKFCVVGLHDCSEMAQKYSNVPDSKQAPVRVVEQSHIVE
mmetsp:Transcript_50923/g.122773  ORF Transcript_50923/g.122773 Transcript_50923/m.122773 type:complete len:156 (+) Transcript_50923:257-724(+)